jgi:RND family efflux transporter MFP subunit
MNIKYFLTTLILLPFLAQGQEAIPVEVKSFKEVLVARELRAPAEVQTLNDSTISAEISAVVERIHADAGQAVKKGDLLVALDDTDYQLMLQQAEAGLASSEAQKTQAVARLARARDLGEKDFLSADDLLARETDMAVAESQILVQKVNVATARRQLEKCKIYAPFNGVVSHRQAQLGSYVGPGTALVTLVETDRFEINAEIPANLADTLSSSSDIRFADQEQSRSANLLRLSPVIDTERRTRNARLEFTGESAIVGSSGELVWVVAKGLLPANLLVRRGGELGIFLFEDGVATFLPILSAQEGRRVSTDLPEDTRIIIRGRDRLQQGDLVSISKP